MGSELRDKSKLRTSRLLKEGINHLKVLSRKHRRLHLEKFRISNRLAVDSESSVNETQKFRSYYQSVFERELKSKQTSMAVKRPFKGAEVEGEPTEKIPKSSFHHTQIQTQSERSGISILGEKNQSRVDEDMVAKRERQQMLLEQPLFKYPRVPPSISSSDVTPASDSPLKDRETVPSQNHRVINPIALGSMQIKQEPSDDDKPVSELKVSVTSNFNSIECTISSSDSSLVTLKRESAGDSIVVSNPEPQINYNSPAKCVKTSPTTPPCCATSSVSADQLIMDKVNALKMSGMLSAKRLPKVQESKRSKTHWDYVLSEMIWMQTDFYQEHLWKVNAGRVLAEACRKFLIVTLDTSNLLRIPPNFIRKRKHTRKMAEIVSCFWANVSKVVDIKKNLLEQETRNSFNKFESDMDAPRINRSCFFASAPNSASSSISAEREKLGKTHGESLDIVNEDVFLVTSQLSANSDTSHISLGLDSAEMEKEIGHIMQMDDIFNESFNVAGEKLNKSPSATSSIPIGWYPTPGDHLASLESKFLGVEKFAVNILEVVFYDQMMPIRDLNYEDDDDMLTIDRAMAESEFCCVTDNEPMVTYYPPTPPIDDNDVYIDESVLFWYKSSPLKDYQLPPVSIPLPALKSDDKKHLKSDWSPNTPMKLQQKLTIAIPPPTLFSSPLPASQSKIKLELLERRSHGVSIQRPFLKAPHLPCKGKPVMQSMVNLDGLCEWLPNEDWALVSALLGVMQMPADLSVVMPGIVPNWDFVATSVNNMSRCFRSPKQVRGRYEKYLKSREEGRTVMTEIKRKQKQTQAGTGVSEPSPSSKITKLPKTCHLLMQDMNNSATYVFGSKFDLIRNSSSKRTKQTAPVQWISVPTAKNPRHSQSFLDCKINYDTPMTPQYLSEQRAIRLKSEKRNQSTLSGGGSGKHLVDALFSGTYTGAMKRSQTSVIAPRGSGTGAATGGHTPASAVNIPAALCRQLSSQRRSVPIQSSSVGISNPRNNPASFASQSQVSGTVRVIQPSGETSSVAQKVTADYQRMILSSKQREGITGGASSVNVQPHLNQKQRIGQLVQPGNVVSTAGLTSGSGSIVYNLASKNSAKIPSNADSSAEFAGIVGVRGISPAQLQTGSKSFGYIQAPARSSLTNQLASNSSSANQIQMKAMTSSSVSNNAPTIQLTNMQSSATGGIVSAARFAAVVQRSSTSAAGGSQMFSSGSRVQSAGNLSTAAQLLGRQGLMRKPAALNSAQNQSRAASSIIVPSTTQSYIVSQLQYHSSKQQHQMPAPQSASNFSLASNSANLDANSNNPPIISSQLSSGSQASASLTSGQRRSAFVQPLPSVTSIQNYQHPNNRQHQSKQ